MSPLLGWLVRFSKVFSDSLSEKLDPTKGAEEDVDPSRYGIGAPNKPSGAQYTAAASAPFG